MKRLIMLMVMMVMGMLLGTSVASAHGSHNTSDFDNDGNNDIRYYKTDDFGSGFGPGIQELKDLHDRYPNHAPDWIVTTDKPNAEVIIRWQPPDSPIYNYDCGNTAEVVAGDTDYLYLDPSCNNFKIPVMHEGGHLLGMDHHPCPDDQNRTVMVPTCIILNTWGPHDENYAQNIPFGV